MGKLVEMVEKLCFGCPARGKDYHCPVTLQLAREIELLWQVVNELRNK